MKLHEGCIHCVWVLILFKDPKYPGRSLCPFNFLGPMKYLGNSKEHVYSVCRLSNLFKLVSMQLVLLVVVVSVTAMGQDEFAKC